MGKKKKIFITVAVICIILLCFIGIFFLVKHFKNKNKEYELEKITSWKYFTIVENNKMGVIDNKGNVIIEPNYNTIQIPNPTKDVFICINDD